MEIRNNKESIDRKRQSNPEAEECFAEKWLEMGRNMKKRFVIMAAGMIMTLTGCRGTLSEDDLVDNGQAFELEQTGEDLQASSFPKEQGRKNRMVTLKELREEVKEMLGGGYLPDTPIGEREMESQVGITKDMYIEYLAERQISGEEIDTMIIVHAKEDFIGEVEEALEQYRAGIIEENQKKPENLGKAEASRMETIEDYVCFVQLGAQTADLLAQGQEAVSSHCLEENEKAIHVLEQAILQ